MQVFLETAERGSLSAAARALGMSRAMATRYLEGLEAWLGTRLLHRTTRKLSLTSSGEQTLIRSRELLQLAEQLQAETAQNAATPQGKLRVTATPAFAQSQLTPVLVEFQNQYPNVEIELLVFDRTVNFVEERIDLAIRISNQVDETLVARPLAVCHSVLCAAPTYLAKHGTPRTPQDLALHRYIGHSSGILPAWQDETQSTFSNHARETLKVNDIAVVQAAACSGAGIAMLPTFYADQAISQGQLSVVLPDYPLKPLNIQAVYLSRRHQPNGLRVLIEFLLQRFKGPVAPWDHNFLYLYNRQR